MTLMNQTGMICAGCGAQTGTVVSVCPSCKDWAKHLVQLTDERDEALALLKKAVAIIRRMQLQDYPGVTIAEVRELEEALDKEQS